MVTPSPHFKFSAYIQFLPACHPLPPHYCGGRGTTSITCAYCTPFCWYTPITLSHADFGPPLVGLVGRISVPPLRPGVGDFSPLNLRRLAPALWQEALFATPLERLIQASPLVARAPLVGAGLNPVTTTRTLHDLRKFLAVVHVCLLVWVAVAIPHRWGTAYHKPRTKVRDLWLYARMSLRAGG